MAAVAEDRERLLAVLVPHAGGSAEKLFDVAGGLGVGRQPSASRESQKVAGESQKVAGTNGVVAMLHSAQFDL